MATVKLNMTDLMYIEKFVEKAKKMKVLSLERSMNTDVSYIRGEFEKKVWVQGATPNAQRYMNQQIERWANRMADMNRKTKEEQEARRKGPPEDEYPSKSSFEVFIAKTGNDPSIMLDPGHGGNDPGTVKRNLKLHEKSINFRISEYIEVELKTHGLKKVNSTRDMDSYVGLRERVNKTKNAFSNIFISIHVNASNNPNADAVDIYTHPSANTQSKELSNSVSKTLKTIVHSRIGVRQLTANFAVLRGHDTDMAAILIEVGFITNAMQEQLLNTSQYQKKIAGAIAQGIINYINQ